MKIGICVGHSRRGDSGAESVGGVDEWTYNAEVARELDIALERRGIDAVIIDDYQRGSYGAGIARCAEMLRESACTHAIELHFNSAGPTATGHEWLYWATSRNGKRFADIIERAFSIAFPTHRRRGIKPKSRGSRGSTFLRRTHCPAIIAEPFFGSNSNDWNVFGNAQREVARAIASGIALLK